MKHWYTYNLYMKVFLHRLLPKARVLYCSATGVTDVKNMVSIPLVLPTLQVTKHKCRWYKAGLLVSIEIPLSLKYVGFIPGLHGETRTVGCGGTVPLLWAVHRVCPEEGAGYGGDVGHGDEDVWDVRVQGTELQTSWGKALECTSIDCSVGRGTVYSQMKFSFHHLTLVHMKIHISDYVKWFLSWSKIWFYLFIFYKEFKIYL